MLTEARLQANQSNAQHSTGPRTPEGKAIASRNALKYGIFSTTKLLPTEDLAELAHLTKTLLADLDPITPTETELANQLIDLHWRLRRVSNAEANILSQEAPDYKALNTVSLHGARLQRQLSQTLKDFRTLHAEGIELRNKQYQQAETIYAADAILKRPSTLEDYGFVFSLDRLETFRARKSNYADCKDIVDHWLAHQKTGLREVA